MKLIIYFVSITLGFLFTFLTTFSIFIPLQQKFQNYIVLIVFANFWINFYIGLRVFHICEYLIKKLNK